MSIRSEIEVRLANFASTQSPKIPVAYENVPFVKPTTGPYLEIMFLSTVSQNTELSARFTRITGIFQINCYCPLGSGMAAVEALAQKIVDLYPVIPKTGTVSIEAPLDASSGIVVEGFMCIPVTGKYRVEA